MSRRLVGALVAEQGLVPALRAALDAADPAAHYARWCGPSLPDVVLSLIEEEAAAAGYAAPLDGRSPLSVLADDLVPEALPSGWTLLPRALDGGFLKLMYYMPPHVKNRLYVFRVSVSCI